MEIDPALLSSLRNVALHPFPDQRSTLTLELIAARVEAIWPTDGAEMASWLRTVAAALDGVAPPETSPPPAPEAEPVLQPAAPGPEPQEPQAQMPLPHPRGRGRRARTGRGRFQADDPATSHINEAYLPADSHPPATEP